MGGRINVGGGRWMPWMKDVETINRLRQRISQLEAQLATAEARVEELARENKHLSRQLETKDNALKHYANPKNISWPHIKEDGGRIARAALEGKNWKDTDEGRRTTVVQTPFLPDVPASTLDISFGGKSRLQKCYEKNKALRARVEELEEKNAELKEMWGKANARLYASGMVGLMVFPEEVE